ncbi:MAG: dipicolinate synthase subunit DpsA [Oscillospiraceae bacterium]|nr:dipicolinate synthase subunit DpsA [Oscillospiraceae bacterium]
MKKRSFYIAGGDLRSVYLAKALAKEGFETAVFALEGAALPESTGKIKTTEEFEKAENVILPLPCCDGEGFLKSAFSDERIPVSEIIGHLPKGAVLMGGLLPKSLSELAEERGIAVYDYYRREEFAVRNAALTAEAAAAIVMEMLSESISTVPVLILGHGRIGRLLSAILKALDAKVTVAARRYSDLAWIRSEGMTPLEFRLLDDEIGKFRVVFNTVPAMVLNREKLVLMDKNAIIIDLASEPCGTDFTAAEELGITAKKALGLPGKFAPKTAGEIVKDTVLNILAEREDEHGK